MNFFILRDGTEAGPYTWVEVFILLRKGEIAIDALARLEGEAPRKTLEEWDLWREGDEVGPLTWDEISIMLREGVLDVGVQARLEGEPQLSRLEEVIGRSEEVRAFEGEEDQPDLRSRILAWFTRLAPSLSTTSFRVGATAAAALILVIGMALLLRFGGGKQTTPDAPAPSNSIEAVNVATLPVPTPSQELTASQTLPTAEPEIAVLPQTPTETIAQSPNEQNQSTPVVAAASAKPVDKSPPLTPAPEASIAPQPQQKPARISQSPLPTPKAASTPQAPVATISDFFAIQSVKFLKKEPKDGMGVWHFGEMVNKKQRPDEFLPCLQVKITAKENIRADKVTAKAYFFDGTNKLLASALTPSKAGKHSERTHFEMPVLFYKDKPDSIFFEVPEKVRNTKWKAVVVFGDKQEAQSACYPPTETDFLLSYPEKQLVYDRTTKRVARKAAMDPLIEHLVKTRNPQMPEVTLFLRPPKGISDASEVQGVLAICLLANSLEDMKRELRKEEMPGDYAGLFSFANKHKLAIVAWGSRRLWDPRKNYDELSREQVRDIDKSLDTVATAWERGIKELGEKYGIPQKDFLLWGNCGSAQWAQRLCLRKPEYFLAVHLHMPGSYDKPTPEAANVLWCLTIGELESGYERSKRWVKTVRDMGYPIVYKAIPGLGHAGHPDAAALGFEFYTYALSQQKEREQLENGMRPSSAIRASVADALKPWPAMFQNPPFYGDMVNQEIYPSSQIEMIPAGFRIALPTKNLADIWARNK